VEVEVAITGEQEVVGKQEGAMVMAGTYFLDHKQMTNGKNTLMRGKRKSMKG
jgi:cation transport ATPase